MLPIAFSEKQADEPDLQSLRSQTIQDLNEARKTGGFATFWFTTQNGPILAPWGTRERERQLRLYYRHEYSTLLQGAFMGLIKKVKSTPWTLDGGKILTNKFQRVLQDAQFGYGWGDFLSRFLLDYLRFDGGAYAEIIAPGDPLQAPTGPAIGIAHLDSYQCLPTGDPEYPVVYWSRMGKLHLMHRTRILHMVDMPDGDQFNPGYGLCALSRAIAVVEREMLMGRYIAANLNDKPSPGFVIANNMDQGMRDRAFAAYSREQNRDYPPDWGNVVWLYSLNPQYPATLTNETFSRPPEKFDYKVYVELDVDMMALALGVDRQEIWPLQTRSMGSGAQSEILAEKAKGKAFGDILISLERLLNTHVLPAELEFQFKTSDAMQAQQDAQTALVWAQTVAAIPPTVMSDVEKRQLLSDNVEAVQDVVTDERGQLIEVVDTDVVPLALESGQITSAPTPTAADLAVGKPQGAAGKPGQTTATDSSPLSPTTTKDFADDMKSNTTTAKVFTPHQETRLRMIDGSPYSLKEHLKEQLRYKDFADTSSAFMSSLGDLTSGLLADDVNRRRAGVVMRAQLNTYGKAARNDGLQDGGVTTGLSDADLNDHTVWLAQQSQYVTSFLDSAKKDGLSDAEIQAHTQMWSNKALQSAYYGGLQSADANGMYEFAGDDGKESCATCQGLKGTKMRLSEWTDKALRPGVDTDNYECGGWNCAHKLERVTAKE